MIHLPKSAAVLFLVFLLPWSYGCSEEEESPSSPPFQGVENNLVFRRTDGTEIEFGEDTRVWIGYWETSIKVEALHIVVSDALQTGGSLRYWSLKAVIDDIEIGEKIEFPNTFIWNDPQGMLLFIYDEPNELSTQEEESRGWITFHKLKTGGPGEVSFTIDAVLGSEYHDGDSCSVQGTFRSSIGSAPF